MTKKLLKLWICGKQKQFKLRATQIAHLSEKLQKLKKYITSEFNRKPRSLSELPRWKATEFRQFLLYTGIVVLQNILPPEYYFHFIVFQCAVFILCSKNLVPVYGVYANSLLTYFVGNFAKLYGKENISYNVHCLLHVYEDVETFGDLNQYSAFKFEDYLGGLKRLVRSGYLPLAQVSRRLCEREIPEGNKHLSQRGASREHTFGPLLPGFSAPQYKQYIFPTFVLKIRRPDQFVWLSTGYLFKVKNIVSSEKNGEVFMIGQKCLDLTPFFTKPINSTLIGIYCFEKLDGLETINICEVNKKYMVFPKDQSINVAFPLIHC